MKSFTDLGLSSQLVEVCEKKLVWYDPMEIQTQVIPVALKGKDDVFAICPPGTGKVGAYVLPILQALLDAGPTNLNPFFACVLSPTSSHVFHIVEYFMALGSQFGVKCGFIVDSYDMVHESKQISQQPHVIVGTPEAIFDHLRHSQGSSLVLALAGLKYLVIDDPLMMWNEQQLYVISEMIPSERRTLLFSSTLTEKVHTIQSVCLRNPVKIDVSSKYSIVDTLQQSCSMRAKHKDCYLVYTLAEMRGRTTMVFTQTCLSTLLLALILKNLGFRAIPIIIYMSQAKKLESLNAFKSGECNILLCSDRASRGLDIPAVDMLINYGIPIEPNDYMYRVGCTAHADVAISFVSSSQDAERFKMIERFIGNRLPVYPAPHEDVLLLEKRVSEAEIYARKEMKEFGWKSGGYLEDEDVHKIQGFFGP